MADQAPISNERVSISLSTLRAELGALELRLVDRLNGALANKADRAIQDQVVARLSDVTIRVQSLENGVLKSDGPVAQQVAAHEKELIGLRVITGYRKWLWAQTVAIIGLAIALASVVIQGGAVG